MSRCVVSSCTPAVLTALAPWYELPSTSPWRARARRPSATPVVRPINFAHGRAGAPLQHVTSTLMQTHAGLAGAPWVTHRTAASSPATSQQSPQINQHKPVHCSFGAADPAPHAAVAPAPAAQRGRWEAGGRGARAWKLACVLSFCICALAKMGTPPSSCPGRRSTADFSVVTPSMPSSWSSPLASTNGLPARGRARHRRALSSCFDRPLRTCLLIHRRRAGAYHTASAPQAALRTDSARARDFSAAKHVSCQTSLQTDARP